jgi:hypothetical protein
MLTGLSDFPKPRLSETDQVRDDAAVSGFGEYGDHFAIEVRPRGFTVEQEYDFAVGGAFIEVMDPVVSHFQIVWLEVISRQIFEPGIRGTQDSRFDRFAGRQHRAGESENQRCCNRNFHGNSSLKTNWFVSYTAGSIQ